MNRLGRVVAGISISALLIPSPPFAQQAGSSPPSQRVQVNLVLLDTIVTDQKGNPVRGLGPEDFDLLVDNVRVSIKSVEEKCEGSATAATSGRVERGPTVGANHFILFFDMSHMMAVSRRDAIRAAIRFINEMKARDDQVMLLAFMRGLHLLSGFTNDRHLLLHRLETLLDDRALTDTASFEEFNRLEQLADEYRSRRRPTRRGPGGAMPVVDRIVPFECESESRIAEIGTAAALRAIGRAMPVFGALPGRKALIFFTETLRADPGLPFYEACGASTLNRFSLGLTVLPEMDDVTRKANISGVSFYPVHAGGLFPGRTPSAIRSARDLQVGLALATGGKEFVLMNDPLKPFAQAARDLSCHYVIAYEPPDGFMPGQHRVSLRTRRKGCRVRHREYFSLETPSESSDREMLAALASPGLYRELKVEAHAYSLSPAERGQRQVLVKASVPRKDIILVPVEGGQARGAVHFRGAAISQGRTSCEFTQTIALEDPVEPESLDGVVGLETMCTLAPGAHEVAVAVRDEGGGSLGAFWGRIEVKPVEKHPGPIALLWAPAGEDTWNRRESPTRLPSELAGLFVRSSYRLGASEKGALTYLVCYGSDALHSGDEDLHESRLRLSGPVSVDLPARGLESGKEGHCRLLLADLPRTGMPPGRYAIEPLARAGWRPVGSPVKLEIE